MVTIVVLVLHRSVDGYFSDWFPPEPQVSGDVQLTVKRVVPVCKGLQGNPITIFPLQ